MGLTLFIVGLIILLIGIGLFFFKHQPTDYAGRKVGEPESLAPFGALALIVAAVLIALSSVSVVGARNVGVVTQFGADTGRNLDSGLAWKLPWQGVTDIDASIQTQKFVGEEGGPDLDCVGVRIADGSTACVSAVIRTRVNKDAANDIYANYRNSDLDINEAVNDALVRTQLTSAIGTVFGDFDPLLEAGDDVKNVGDVSPNLQAYSADVLEEMDALLAEQAEDGVPEVEVTSLTISYIYFSKDTQDRLNQLQAEVGRTRIAEQEQATAEKQKVTNDILSESLADNPYLLQSKCLDALLQGIEKGYQFPAGFNCNGSSAPFVVGAK